MSYNSGESKDDSMEPDLALTSRVIGLLHYKGPRTQIVGF